MALLMDITTKQGLSALGSYWRVKEIVTRHNGDNVHEILVCGYKDKAWYQAGGEEFDRVWVSKTYDPTSSVDFAELYTFLKTQDFFLTATDDI